MSVLSTLFCVVVLLGVSSIHAHVISPFRHLTGITLDRVTDVTFPPATEAPTPSPTPKPKKTFVIDVDDVHGHVVPTTEVPVKKKRKRPDLHAWSKDNKDKTEIDPKIINQFIAAASTPDELTDGQPAVKIVKLKDTKGRTRAPPTEPPTSPPTKPATKLRVEPPAESSTESQEEAAHEEEVEEESRLKRMRKTNRAKGQESVRDYEKEHQHEDEKPRREEETMSHENHRDTARDQHETTHDNERHDDTHDTDDDTRKRSSSSDTTHTSSASDTEVHSAIPFEPVDEHIKEVLHWKENNKESTKKQWTWEKENKDERKKQKDDAAHDETQTSTSKKKRKEDTDDHSHDHIERRSRQDDDTHDETPRRTRKDETDTHDQHDETSRKTRHDEDDHDKPKSKATWEWKDEKNPTKKEDDKKVASKPTTPKAKATPVPKTGHDAVDRLVANMAADFAAHLEAEKAAGHDVTHLTVGDTKSSSKSDKPYVPPIHHDNLAHHDYVDPDKVQFADSIVKWHAPAAPPAIKVVDETAIEREADGSVHLRGAKPPAEGGPAGIDLALP